MASCPLAADPAPAAAAPCNCSRENATWVEPTQGRTGFLGRLRGWFRHSPAEDSFLEGITVSQPGPVRVVAAPPAPLGTIATAGARIPTTAEPPLAPGGAPNLASLGR